MKTNDDIPVIYKDISSNEYVYEEPDTAHYGTLEQVVAYLESIGYSDYRVIVRY